MVMRTWLEELSPEECRYRLATNVLGRIAVFVDGRPEIFPVNHAFDERTGSVVFPTNAGTKAWGALHWPWLSFEIDGIEAEGEPGEGPYGWSVLVVGRAEELTSAEEVHRAQARRPIVWAVGPTTRWLRIVPARVTGRRIRMVSAPDGV